MAGAMSRGWRAMFLGTNMKRMMYERIVVPIVLCEEETCCLNATQNRRLSV